MPDHAPRLAAAAARRAHAAPALLRGMIGAQGDGEAAVQAMVARGLAEAGAEVSTLRYRPSEVKLIEEFAADPPPGERETVLGTLPGAGGGRSLILLAHRHSEPRQQDHGWSLDPFAGAMRDGRKHGWGVSDDLSGVPAMVSALDVLRDAGLAPAGRVMSPARHPGATRAACTRCCTTASSRKPPSICTRRNRAPACAR